MVELFHYKKIFFGQNNFCKIINADKKNFFIGRLSGISKPM